MNLPIGTHLELALNTNRLKTNSQFAFLNPEYNTFGSFNLRQPLLGGFAASARKQLTSAERELEAEKARYDQQVLAVSAEVERAYWDLYAAERDYAVQKLTRDRAETFLHETEVRARTGLVGPSEVATAKTFLAEQELLLIDLEERLGRQSDQLASLIGIRPTTGVLRFIPAGNPPSDFSVEPVEILVERALKNNLDLQAAQKNVQAVRALAKAAKWEALPSVDFVGSYGASGLSGAAQDVIFGGATFRTSRGGSFGDALSQVDKLDFPSWSVGVEVSIPIGFRSGLGEKDRLVAQVVGAQQSYIELSRILEEQVRAAHREVSHGRARLKAASEGVQAAHEQVRIGLIEYHNGRATAFELVRLGEDSAVAQRRYSEALVRTAKAAATLRQLTSDGHTARAND
jgi:outer membrane protein TolC